MKKRLFKYGVVGLLGTLLHFGVLYVLVEAAFMNPIAASALGFILVLCISYLLNRRWTFEASTTGWIPLLKYTVVSCTGLLLNTLIMYISVDLLDWHYLIGQCLVVLAVPLSNFVFNSYWTFKNRTDTG
jgi:putative flippase GtrA